MATLFSIRKTSSSSPTRCVRPRAGGAPPRFDITVHSAGSLFGHPEIKDAVRRGLVPIGEILLSRLANENPVFEI